MQRAVTMTSLELRVVAVLASIFSFRILGLCMLLPVFAIEASKFPQANEQLIGMAIGAYGLSQALLQLPFGIISDKYGRKPLIILGLCLLLLGSLIAARATSIYELIIGRVLQGSGAIGSVIIATMLDHTREQVRTRSMAILGVSLGLSFVLAMVLGPWFTQILGFAGIFWVTAFLAIMGIALLIFAIPKTAAWQPSLDLPSFAQNLQGLFKNAQLLNFNFGVFSLHASLSALFLVLPLLIQKVGVIADKVWQLYLVSLLVALFLSLRMIAQAERKRQLESLQIFAILGLLLAEVVLATFTGVFVLVTSLVVFFTAFCVLEASLPSLVSKIVPENIRGMTMGIYSSLQFLGIFIGGTIGGWLHGQFGIIAVLIFCVVLASLWLGVSVILRLLINKEVNIWLGV